MNSTKQRLTQLLTPLKEKNTLDMFASWAWFAHVPYNIRANGTAVSLADEPISSRIEWILSRWPEYDIKHFLDVGFSMPGETFCAVRDDNTINFSCLTKNEPLMEIENGDVFLIMPDPAFINGTAVNRWSSIFGKQLHFSTYKTTTAQGVNLRTVHMTSHAGGRYKFKDTSCISGTFHKRAPLLVSPSQGINDRMIVEFGPTDAPPKKKQDNTKYRAFSKSLRSKLKAVSLYNRVNDVTKDKWLTSINNLSGAPFERWCGTHPAIQDIAVQLGIYDVESFEDRMREFFQKASTSKDTIHRADMSFAQSSNSYNQWSSIRFNSQRLLTLYVTNVLGVDPRPKKHPIVNYRTQNYFNVADRINGLLHSFESTNVGPLSLAFILAGKTPTSYYRKAQLDFLRTECIIKDDQPQQVDFLAQLHSEANQ